MIVIGQAVVDWVAQKTGGIFGVARGIGLKRSERIVAGVAYTDFNKRNVFVHAAIDGRVTRQFLWTICDYPFNQLNAERVTAMIPASHQKARKLADGMGFEFETKLKKAHPTGDLMVYVAWREKMQWLTQYRKAA